MKPILYLIPAFDSALGTTIKFSWFGNQPVSNTVIIKDNATNKIVYEQSQTTMRLEHQIPILSGLINTNNTLTLKETMPSSSNYQFCALINE